MQEIDLAELVERDRVGRLAWQWRRGVKAYVRLEALVYCRRCGAIPAYYNRLGADRVQCSYGCYGKSVMPGVCLN